MHAGQARRRILGDKHCNCRRADLFFPKAGFVQILSSGKSETPPCKSGQLEKDLGLEASSARQAARVIIFEIMRSFFPLVSMEQATKLAALHWDETHGIFRTLAVSVRALSHFNLDSFGFWCRCCREMHF